MPIPPIFSYIAQIRGYPLKEMLPVYNIGHRLDLYIPETLAPETIEMANAYDIETQVVGTCEKSDTETNQLTITRDGQTIQF